MTDILIEPVLSEKATTLREQGKYTFKVAPDRLKKQYQNSSMLQL